MPPRFQVQPQHRTTASPQPTPATTNNFDSHWTQGRRYGGESSEENRDRHTPDTYGDRYKSTQGRDRYQDRHSFNESDHRRHFDRKERESESERSEDSYKKSRDSEQGARQAKDDRKEPSSEREAWRAPAHNDREDEHRRPQRPDSRDSRTSRESRNSREEKHDSELKSRNAPAQLKEEKSDVKGPPKHVATPPRDLPDLDKKPSQPSPAPSPKIDAHSAATDEHHKDEKDDKSSPQDENKQKGGKSARGNRWGSGASTTYVRNGSRGERRRRTSGGSYSRPENESGSSGEGGSELDKGEKEERNKETRRSADGTGRDGFAPSGQPSRRGRGAARVRSGGSGNVPRRMDGGYGPPPIKATFSQPEQPAPVEEEEEDPTKQKQAALNAGIAGGAAKAAAAAAAASTVNQRGGGAARTQRNTRYLFD